MTASNLFLYLLFIASPILLIFILIRGSKIKKLLNAMKETRALRQFEKIRDDAWDKVLKMREMKAIEKENLKALGNIKTFLKDKYADHQFLKEAVVPEFNSHAPAEEHLPSDLPEKKLRKAILEKAEEYYATSNPLLEILEESFMASTRQKLGKN